MGMFAETAIVDHHVSFADQRKQSCVSANKQKFVVSVYCCSKQTEAAIFRKFRFLFEGALLTSTRRCCLKFAMEPSKLSLKRYE
jgi:hypothetical protein